MSTAYENKSSTFFSTQSYIANGMPNPSFKVSKKDYLSSLIKNKNGKKSQNKAKSKTKINPNYINEVKKNTNKNQKVTSLKKPKQQVLLKNYINNKLDEKNEINNKINNKLSRNAYIYNTKTEKFKNISQNYLYSKTHNYTIKNNDNNFEGKENNKNEMNILSCKKSHNNPKLSNHGLDKSNGFCKAKNNNPKLSTHGLNKSNGFCKANNIHEEYFSKTNKSKGVIKFDFSDLIHKSNLGYATTRLNLNSKKKNYKKNIDDMYNIAYHSKIKQNKKRYTSFQKDSKFISKFFSNDNDDYLNIKNQRNKNKLLNKLNLYTKRENINFEEENKTQRGLLTIKHLINKKSLFSPESNKSNNKSINYFHKSLSTYKQHNNYLNKFSRNKELLSPSLTEYNINKNKNIKQTPSTKLFKTKICSALSKVINSIREDRKTCKFIKELNKNKKIKNNSNKNIRFSFSGNKDNDIIDEFYSPNKNKINIIQFNENNKRNNKQNINYFIKKNISSGNFRRNSKNKNKYNAINVRINNFINAYNDKKNNIMPVNKAI